MTEIINEITNNVKENGLTCVTRIYDNDIVSFRAYDKYGNEVISHILDFRKRI